MTCTHDRPPAFAVDTPVSVVDLTGWEIRDVDPGHGHNLGSVQGDGWVSAPGDVYSALIEGGRLAHPYQHRNEAGAAWVRDREWWWRTTFTAPAHDREAEDVELVFEGLDTFATLYLDGEEIGSTDNMFRRYAFDIGNRIEAGRTYRLAIRFDPPGAVVPAGDLPVWTAFNDRVSRSKRNLMRKAQFGWGWDWGPDLPTVGVWRPARVEVRPRLRLRSVGFDTLALSSATAEAVIQVEVEDGAKGPQAQPDRWTVRVELADPEGRTVFEAEAAVQATGESVLNFPATIAAPRAWWTADMGEQPLYDLRVRLSDGGRRRDEMSRKVGLRTFEIDESPDPDEPGARFFRFVLNGVPIFAKGACWVPATSFLGDLEREPYERLIHQAAEANMNMIRVWGGGVYEPDRFYDLCDRMGLLVWQDFMFACAHYPETGDFAASVKAEVEDQVRRLRSHPSLALWCGNNESQAMNRINTDLGGDPVRLSGEALYDTVIPEVLARLAPRTPYRPGSPWGGDNPNGMMTGDVHDWTVWHGVPPIPDGTMIGEFRSDPEGVSYLRYAEDMSRFVSEFGLQAAPALATLKRWMDPADLHPDNEGFHERIKDEARKADAMMIPVTGLPRTIQDYVNFTQWCQAEGLKFGIEHFRRRRPHCSGALLWQFNDCWPCVSWSLVDYDGVVKAAYHAVRRAFAPVLASFKATPGGEIELWISNDTQASVRGQVTVSLETFDGTVARNWTVAYDAPAGGHATPWRGDLPAATDRLLRASSPDRAFEAARHLFTPIKDLRLIDARPRIRASRLGPCAFRIELASDVWTPFVHLSSARPDLRYSDNHFDLFLGETRTIIVTSTIPFGALDLGVSWWRADGIAREPVALSDLIVLETTS